MYLNLSKFFALFEKNTNYNWHYLAPVLTGFSQFSGLIEKNKLAMLKCSN